MTPLDPTTLEQLCAWMDGELPSDEARFLERRLAGDRELRAQWERWQLASACLRGQPLRLMHADLGERVQAAIAGSQDPGVVARRGMKWGWAVAASIAALALIVGVQMRPAKIATPPVATAHVGDSFSPVAASPASADLVELNGVAGTSVADSAEPATTVSATPASVGKGAAKIRPSASMRASEVASRQSPMPLNAQSPTEFPLLATSEAKSWPRSPLSASGNDTSMEAYLVRHNELVSGGGLGGFVPYVDVVTRERDGASDAGAEDAAANGDDTR